MWFRRTRRLLGWTTALVVALAAIKAIGDGPLAPPRLSAPDSWGDWLAGRDGVDAAMAIVRLSAEGMLWYLLGVTALALAAQVSRVPALLAAAGLATVPALRPVLGSLLGLGVAATTLVPAAAGASPLGRAPTKVTATVGTRLPASLSDGAMPESGATTATMRHLVDASPPSPPPEPEASRVATWEIRPGDHLWRVAERTLTAAIGRAPSQRELAAYWRRLVAVNRSILRDPANPDLVFTGQVMILPPVDAGT